MRWTSSIPAALGCATASAAPLPVETPPRNGLLALWGDGKPALLRPGGRVFRDLSCKGYGKEGVAALSPDGKLALSVIDDERLCTRLLPSTWRKGRRRSWPRRACRRRTS